MRLCMPLLPLRRRSCTRTPQTTRRHHLSALRIGVRLRPQTLSDTLAWLISHAWTDRCDASWARLQYQLDNHGPPPSSPHCVLFLYVFKVERGSSGTQGRSLPVTRSPLRAHPTWQPPQPPQTSRPLCRWPSSGPPPRSRRPWQCRGRQVRAGLRGWSRLMGWGRTCVRTTPPRLLLQRQWRRLWPLTLGERYIPFSSLQQGWCDKCVYQQRQCDTRLQTELVALSVMPQALALCFGICVWGCLQ